MQDLIALLLATGETLVDGAIEELFVHLHQFHLLFDQGQEVHGIQFTQTAVFAHRVDRRLEQIDITHAGDLHRVLKGEKHPFAGPLLGRQLEKVIALEPYFAAHHLITLAARQDIGQGALAGTVGPHDGVHLTGLDLEIDALKNGLAVHVYFQILDTQHVTRLLDLGCQPSAVSIR